VTAGLFKSFRVWRYLPAATRQAALTARRPDIHGRRRVHTINCWSAIGRQRPGVRISNYRSTDRPCNDRAFAYFVCGGLPSRQSCTDRRCLAKCWRTSLVFDMRYWNMSYKYKLEKMYGLFNVDPRVWNNSPALWRLMDNYTTFRRLLEAHTRLRLSRQWAFLCLNRRPA